MDPQTSAWFGASVGISGDRAVVGALQADVSGGGNPQGAAYVFVRVSGAWSQEQKITNPVQGTGPQFGYSVAIDADTLVIGARFGTFNSVRSGAAFVYTRTGSTWNLQATLVSNDAEADDWFGSSVSIHGDTVVVGAPREEEPAGTGVPVDRGAAYVFTRSGTTWSQQAKLNAPDAGSSDAFGTSVCVKGDQAIVGAPLHKVGTSFFGSAYIFTRSGTTWTATISLPATISMDGLGTAVGIDGVYAAVGVPGHDVTGKGNVGAIFVYQLISGVWSKVATLTSSDATASDGMGNAVAIEGGTIIAGAQGKQSTRGAAYIFEGSGATWNQTKKAAVAFVEPDDYFGRSVGISGATVICGAQFVNLTGGADQGAAYVFEPAQIPDADSDSITDAVDNCPAVANADQQDTNGDGEGDSCDTDDDGDGTPDDQDGCPLSAIKTVAGSCGCFVPETDTDNDGIPDCIDTSIGGGEDDDADDDGVVNTSDNCPNTANASQADADDDGVGDACDSDNDNPNNDTDGDGIGNSADNCPNTANASQADTDGDGVGDACDSDNGGTPDDGTPDTNQPVCGCNGGQAAVVSSMALLCLAVSTRRRRTH